jgi:hypothetical protein
MKEGNSQDIHRAALIKQERKPVVDGVPADADINRVPFQVSVGERNSPDPFPVPTIVRNRGADGDVHQRVERSQADQP